MKTLKQILLTSLFAGLFSATVAQASLEPMELTTQAQVLNYSFENLSSFFAPEKFLAPTVTQYKMQGSLEETIAALTADGSYVLQAPVEGREATRAFAESLMARSQFPMTGMADGEKSATKDALLKTILKVSDFVATPGMQIYVDQGAFWAPSVQATAIIILNPVDQTVTIILHGDTEG